MGKKDDHKSVSTMLESAKQRADGRFKVPNLKKDQPGFTMTSLKGELERQMSHSVFTKKEGPGATVHFDRNIGLLDMHSNIDERFKDTIKSKQDQLLANPHITTSMTTNIRNIMSSHDKGLLTASSRLLHAEVKYQGQELQQSPRL